MKGKIHSFESLAALDGQGLRYAVFIAGCPLRCVYCHNPDTQAVSGAKYELSPEELTVKVERYRSYFGKNGGVTFTGGEPLVQAEFLLETAKLLEERKIGYVVDTSGCVALTDEVKEVLLKADEVLLDVKFWDAKTYARYTGGDFDKMHKVLDFLTEKGVPTRLRTVIVPGLNDDKDAIKKYAAIAKGRENLTDYELLPFHTMGFFKYDGLRIDNPLKGTAAADPKEVEQLQIYLIALLGGC